MYNRYVEVQQPTTGFGSGLRFSPGYLMPGGFGRTGFYRPGIYAPGFGRFAFYGPGFIGSRLGVPGVFFRPGYRRGGFFY